MEQLNHPFPIFNYSYKCHKALQRLRALLEHNHEKIFRGTQGDILHDAVVKFETRYNELGSQETEQPLFDAQLGESPGKEMLLYHLKGLHQTLERSVDLAMYEEKSGCDYRAGIVLAEFCVSLLIRPVGFACLWMRFLR